MSRMKITIATFYYISQLYYIYAVVKTQQRQLEFKGQDLIFGHESFKDGKLTYAVCTNNNTSNKKICKVMREKEPLSNDTFSCNVTLKILAKKSNEREIGDYIGIVPFAKDKAVLYFIQRYRRTKVKFNTIQFDGCVVSEIDIKASKYIYSKYNIVIVPYSNSYDVIYPSVANGFQKITINVNGERISGPVNLGYLLWLAHFPYILPLSQKSRRKGFIFFSFVLDSNCPDVYDLNVWKPDGTGKPIGRHTIGLRSFKSTDHDLIGICQDDERFSFDFVTCTQYDSDGHRKFETDSIGAANQSVAFIHNVPGGGLLLFGARLKNETEDLDFFITKLNSAGKYNGSVSIGEIQIKAEALAVSFYENEDSDYCISVLDYIAFGTNVYECLNTSSPYHIDQTVSCFNDSDFEA